MPNLKEIKNRIRSVQNTQQITKAMKMVAAAKLRRAQDNMERIKPYSNKLSEILQNVGQSLGNEEVTSPYSEIREVKKVLIVHVTSDRGLCGAFNSNVNKQTRSLLQETYSGLEQVDVMPIGKRGNDYAQRRHWSIATSEYAEIFQELSFEVVRRAAEFAMGAFREGRYDKVVFVYNHFRNVATQEVVVEDFLPMVSEPSGEPESRDEHLEAVNYILEPSAEYIVQELIPKSLKIHFYRVLLESYAAEMGARMMAMDKATDNAQELLGELRLTYNRQRQAAITKEILEIVGGAEALEQSG